ncbi:hypothetical protein N7497_001942 [Penicillium chrysogenum]|nr:hypothetical protein N7497_001942 [Penicillium chrysogenum]
MIHKHAAKSSSAWAVRTLTAGLSATETSPGPGFFEPAYNVLWLRVDWHEFFGPTEQPTTNETNAETIL